MYSYAARQPIFNINRDVYGYELLFRDSLKNAFPNIDGDTATSKLIETTQFNLGLDELTQGSLAFINFSDELVIQKFPTLLPKEQLVVELLENARPTKNLLRAIKELHQAGYRIALDDYIHNPVWLHFFPYIQIIKVRFGETTDKQIKEIVDVSKRFKIQLLAEKIETYEEFQQAKEWGFKYFQGYFFSEPEMLQKKVLAPSTLNLTELLYQSAQPELNKQKIIEIFQSDFSLSFKLLRYANSAMFKRRSEIDSIKQALVFLGEEELKKFLALLFTAQINSDKPVELLTLSICRARFCESVAKADSRLNDPSVAFLAGMMSVIDAILDQPIGVLMEKLPLSEEIKNALDKRTGVLADYIQLIELYEKAHWNETERLVKKLALANLDIAACYREAVIWASKQTCNLKHTPK